MTPLIFRMKTSKRIEASALRPCESAVFYQENALSVVSASPAFLNSIILHTKSISKNKSVVNRFEKLTPFDT